jgi:Kelch motif
LHEPICWRSAFYNHICVSISTIALTIAALCGIFHERFGHTLVAYNGYLYVLGGSNGSNLNDVQYAFLEGQATRAANQS